MKLVKGSDILALGQHMAELQHFVDSLDPDRMKRAVRAGCNEAGLHLTCSWPDCKCKQTPVIVQAAIKAWNAPRTEQTA